MIQLRWVWDPLASSYWAEYVALLPDNTGCILEWTAKEVWDQDAVL